MTIVGAVLFVVLGTTFLAYLLNIFGLRELSPSTVSTYIYTQPVLASLIAISLGKDELDGVKIISALLIFVGVYLVSNRRILNKKWMANFEKNLKWYKEKILYTFNNN